MKTIGVIPARYGSTRFKAKVLADLCGKPLIQHVWERARKSKKLDDLLIACDDQRIFDAAKKFKANVVLTSKDHPSGSDRIAEAVAKRNVDLVVNIQGDEPLIDPRVIDALVKALENDKNSSMATVIKKIERREELNNPNVVKVVVDKDFYALYFSRSLIPYQRDAERVEYWKHLGIYAYRKDFLLKFKDLPKSRLEKIEQLEQLRALENGFKIKAIITDSETIGVDTAEDLKRVKKILSKRAK